MKIFTFALLILIALQSTTCHKQPCDTTYNFDIPFSIIDADSFRTGDTIWLSSTINEKLVDKSSNNSIDVSNFDFKIYSGINRMDTTLIEDAEKYFGVINSIGKFEISFLSGTTNTKVVYDNTNKIKRLKIGLIPKKIGIYKIGFYNLTDDITRIKLTESECLETLNMSYTMNEGKDFNYYLLKYSLQPFPISTENDYKKEGNYVFKVIK